MSTDPICSLESPETFTSPPSNHLKTQSCISMLSNRTNTNPTGHHRRQQSTPIFPAPQPLTRTSNNSDRHPKKYSISQIALHARVPASGSQGTYGADDSIRQHEGQHLQGTQQAVARLGHTSFQEGNQHGGQEPSQSFVTQNTAKGCLLEEEIDALMLGLDQAISVSSSGHTDHETAHEQSRQPCQLAIGSEPECESKDLPLQPSYHNRQYAQFAANYPADSQPKPHLQIFDKPQTPVHGTHTNQMPIMPDTTPLPHTQHGQNALFSRSAQSSPTRKDPNLTIKASESMQRGRSYQDNFAAMKQHGMNSEPMSPPKTAPLARRSVDFAVMPSPNFLSMSDLKMEMPTDGGDYNGNLYSPAAHASFSTVQSFQSSPEVQYMSLFESAEVDNAILKAQLSFLGSQDTMDMTDESSTRYSSPHQKAQSVTDIDVEECIEETGVTVEEIASFIQGPFPEDSKWKCLYEDEPGKLCGKRFARKENAKSHVQTHLGDRQFVCKACNTRFVRQHDLKRHFKIHMTEKPHKCPCGKDFHRHDALTRHRQRGMCVGAFEDSPKKLIKRGRPKKPRPNTEERMEKAAKTRQFVMGRTRPGSTYASSISGSSEYSHGSPPSFDYASVAGSSPSPSYRALEEYSSVNQTYQPITPPTSPGYCTDNKHSSPYSQYSYTPKVASQSPSPKITSIPEESIRPTGRTSDSLSGNYLNTLPELDISSSSPATSNFHEVNDPAGSICGPESCASTEQRLACLNPRFLNGDFPLFELACNDIASPANFDDFFDFGALDKLCPEKPNQISSMNDPIIGQRSFATDCMRDSDNIFGKL